jgi:hypothetical protein
MPHILPFDKNDKHKGSQLGGVIIIPNKHSFSG